MMMNGSRGWRWHPEAVDPIERWTVHFLSTAFTALLLRHGEMRETVVE